MTKRYGIEDVIGVTIAECGLTIESKFIPWSKSRNSKDVMPSLNWEVTLLKNGKEILTTDYSAGVAHCPAYRQNDKSILHHEEIMMECEKGFTATGYENEYIRITKNLPILPEDRDVIYSLLMDAETLDYDFEDWCSNLGFDADSRKAESMYNQCKEITLKLLRIGTPSIDKLRDAFQDY